MYGATPLKRKTNKLNCLRKAMETGARLKLEKSTILENKVDWFQGVTNNSVFKYYLNSWNKL